METVDYIVVGSGIAGLNTALLLSQFGRVCILTKGILSDSSTNLAQGGIAAVVASKDSIESHVQDTLKAGDFHNNEKAVRFLIQNSSLAIDRLEHLGVVFDSVNGVYQTSYEAAHSYPRVLHASDFIGKEIEKVLAEKVKQNAAITVVEHTPVHSLIIYENECYGVHIEKNQKLLPLWAKAVVLATGGLGQLYEWTTNPWVATGDGIALAHQAGARLSDLEFIQFHPTALSENASPLFLLSEALRGEGALLVDAKGVEVVDPLLPRDEVARAIYRKQKESTVYIDIRHKSKAFLQKRFPNIYDSLKSRGYDLATDLVAITPAAHFSCGGIVTDLSGRTTVKNVFAYGEVACTGVHGANRLASNSLLEGVVFSNEIAKSIHTWSRETTHPIAVHFSQKSMPQSSKETYHELLTKVQKLMWKHVGIERTTEGLEFVIGALETLEEIPPVIVARHIAQHALRRKESLGAHFWVH